MNLEHFLNKNFLEKKILKGVRAFEVPIEWALMNDLINDLMNDLVNDLMNDLMIDLKKNLINI